MDTPPDAQTNSEKDNRISDATSELNNLLQIISSTTELIEKQEHGLHVQEYRAILRSSIDRAEAVAAALAGQAGGTKQKTAVQPGQAKTATSSPMGTAGRLASILVVDDEPMALLLVKRILNEAGFEVTTAESGFAAVELFRERPHGYDLVLLDLTMPFMDGEETFTRLREIRAEMPVVLCTGFIQQQRLDRLMTVGLSGFMRKPIGADEIVAFVRSTLASVRYSGGIRAGHMPVAM